MTPANDDIVGLCLPPFPSRIRSMANPLHPRRVEFPEDSDDDDSDGSDDSEDSDDSENGKGKAGKGKLSSKSFAVGPEVVVGVLVKGRVDFAAMDHIFDRQFSLAHTGSHSVFFSGYKTSDATGVDSLYDEDEEIEEDEEEDEEEDSDDDDDEEEEEEDEAMEGSDDEEAAAAAMAGLPFTSTGRHSLSRYHPRLPSPAEKSSKGMAAAAAAAVEKRVHCKPFSVSSFRPSPSSHTCFSVGHRPSPIAHLPSPIAHRPSPIAHCVLPFPTAIRPKPARLAAIRPRIKSGKKGTPVPSPAGGRGAAAATPAAATAAAASKQGTPTAARSEGKDSAPRNRKEVTPKKEVSS
ncbi:unnamed protein product [Closterium sp. NIES-54]